MKPLATLVLPLLVVLVSSGCVPLEGRAQFPEVDQKAIEQAQEEITEYPEVMDASVTVGERRIQLAMTVPHGVSQAKAEERLDDFARLLAALQPGLEGPKANYLGELWDYHYLEAVAFLPDEEPLVVGFRCIKDARPGITFHANYT